MIVEVPKFIKRPKYGLRLLGYFTLMQWSIKIFVSDFVTTVSWRAAMVCRGDPYLSWSGPLLSLPVSVFYFVFTCLHILLCSATLHSSPLLIGYTCSLKPSPSHSPLHDFSEPSRHCLCVIWIMVMSAITCLKPAAKSVSPVTCLLNC